MNDKAKNIVTTVLSALFLIVFSCFCIFRPSAEYSESERRPLAKFPEATLSSIVEGDFAEDFEKYATERIPLRDGLRAVKAAAARFVFGQSDVNDLYMEDGYIAKIEYPLNKDSINSAAEKFQFIYDKYLRDNGGEVYLSLIPDKNYLLSKESGHLALDYKELAEALTGKAPYAKYIDIMDSLEISDFYKTDTHWRQEEIAHVAEKLANEMGTNLSGEYTKEKVDVEFRGVYSGQYALKIPSEELYRLTNDTIDSLTVFDYETNGEIPLFDIEKAQGRDPYEMFLGGSKSLLKITNEKATSDKRLVVFRDSFGSSIVPLLAEGYSEVIVVDIRYISSANIGSFIDFENCDTLFLYSTLVINNSITLK